MTALSLFGLRAFSLDSGEEVPGHGEHDPQELTELMAQLDSPRTDGGTIQ